MKSMP